MILPRFFSFLGVLGISAFLSPVAVQADTVQGDTAQIDTIQADTVFVDTMPTQVTSDSHTHANSQNPSDISITIETWPNPDSLPNQASQFQASQRQSIRHRVSLQFWNGEASLNTYRSQLAQIPDPFPEYVDILSPNFCSNTLNADGTFTLQFADPADAAELVQLGKSRGARVVPMIGGSGKTVANMLAAPAKRTAFVNCVDTLVQTLNCDGFLIDFELLPNSAGNALNSLMEELYARLHPQGKLVIISVMPRTAETHDPWSAYDYTTLSHHCDYIQVMSYDKHYMTSAPGPIAPLAWVDSVMSYTVSQVGDPHKILMGVPYYGRAWKKVTNGYTSLAFGLSHAQQAATDSPTINRHTSPEDPVGIPTFHYIDPKGANRTVYYDDAASWGAKLDLLEKYNLGGIGAWALNWIDEKSAEELFPLLKQKLRTE